MRSRVALTAATAHGGLAAMVQDRFGLGAPRPWAICRQPDQATDDLASLGQTRGEFVWKEVTLPYFGRLRVGLPRRPKNDRPHPKLVLYPRRYRTPTWLCDALSSQVRDKSINKASVPLRLAGRARASDE
jgi:hypothetical protein